MPKQKNRREFDSTDDENLRENVTDDFGFFNQNQYEFSKRLTLKLVERNLTNAEFAEIVEMSEGTISNYVKGKRMPKGDELVRIAEKLFCTPNYLLGLTDCLNFSAEEINRILGLSENAMNILCQLNHNKKEIKELTDQMKVSQVNKNKLDIFSLLIEDKKRFVPLLNCFERYVNIRKQLKNTNFEEDMLNTFTKEDLQEELVGIEGRIIRILFSSLENIANIYRKE